MSLVLRAFLFATLASSPLFAARAHADENCEPVAERSARNPDQSTLSVATVCDKPDFRTYVMRSTAKDGRVVEKRVDVESEYAPTGGARLVDIDDDGYHEIEVRGMCGAGPNCEGEIYRSDRKSGQIELFFSGGYSELLVIDGYLIESGRASCCSWEYHAYRLEGRKSPLDYEHMDFMIVVDAAADPDQEDADAAPRCTFSQVINGSSQVIAPPPGDQWLKLCEVYGAYDVFTPAQARAAEAAGRNQE